MAKQTKADLRKLLDKAYEENDDILKQIRELRKKNNELVLSMENARNNGCSDGYLEGCADKKQEAIDFISESIERSREVIGHCIHKKLELGIEGARTALLSYSNIKIKLMEEL